MKLSKELNLLHVFSICSGAMLSGLFILPGLAYAKAGPAVLASYFIAGLLALVGVYSQAELASAMPKAGGTYFYVMRSMGPAVGTVYGIITWFSLALNSAYQIFFIAVLAAVIFNFNAHFIAVIICLPFLAINIIGVKEAGRMQAALVLTLFAVLLFYIISGLPNVDVQHFENFVPYGPASVLSTAGFIFISFGGLLKIASLSEEVIEPGRILPRGMILSLLVITNIYIIVIFVTIGVSGGEILNGSIRPISDGAMVFLGSWGHIIYTIAAVLAIISSANTGIMSASRYPLALARDEMLPEFFASISPRFKTPRNSVLVTGAVVMAVLFFPLETLVKTASSVLILTYIFTCLAVIILREGRLLNYQPAFYSPGYPWVQIIGTIGFLVLLVEMGREAIWTGIVLIAGGIVIYWFFGKIQSTREYALLHIVERITSKDLTKRNLETELKEIIRERDDILEDCFDQIIEACRVVDIDHAINAEEFFRIAANNLTSRLKMDPETLFALFMKREKESSTVLNSKLAVPHIIIDGHGAFDILLTRCREGISFSNEAPEVHAVFLLVGTLDERPSHLRALAAIAQIVQDPTFDKRWLAARNEESLRDIILLGKRKR